MTRKNETNTAELKKKLEAYKRMYAEMETMAKAIERERDRYRLATNQAIEENRSIKQRLYNALEVKTELLRQNIEPDATEKSFAEALKDFYTNQFTEPLMISRN